VIVDASGRTAVGETGPVGRFAFLLHPLRLTDFTGHFRALRHVPEGMIRFAFRQVPPFKVSTIRGVVSATGARAEGYFVVLPMLPDDLLRAPWPWTLRRLVRAGRLAERLGAEIFGLGAFTKIVGDRGVSVNQALSIPVTTGNSYTAASAVEGALYGVDRMGHRRRDVRAAVIGASGSIGAAVSHLVAREVGEVVVSARRLEPLEQVRERILAELPRDLPRPDIRIETDPRRAARGADLVFAVTSSSEVLLDPEDLAPGSVVCDVARPRNVSDKVLEVRDDVLVIDGGVIAVPGPVDFGFSFGFPPGTAEACIAETMILCLERRLEPFTLGTDIPVERVLEIAALARKHGFKVAGFRRFERAIPEVEVDAVRERARKKRRLPDVADLSTSDEAKPGALPTA
jgi:fatty aldehyde-generating acyl-ACP reductase